MTDYSNNSICVLNNTLNSGGAEKNCVIICNELVKQGIDVELWVTRLGDTPLIDLLDKRVQVIPIPGKKVRYAIVHLKELMLNCKSKTLLIFNIELLVPAFFINKLFRLNLKIVARSISTLSLSYSQQNVLYKKIWLKLISCVFNRIESIVAQSSGMKEDLINNLKIKESKIVVIPNPAYIFKNSIIKEHNNNIHPNEIIFVGRLTHAKGLFYLLDAFQIALQKIPDLHLRMVGTGELKQEIEDRISEVNLTSSISLEGHQTDLISYYTKAKATVLTSIREGFPNVLLESISVGTPVIAFDCPSGPRDIIVPDLNGILVEHLNVEEFAQAIINVANGNIKFDKQKVIESSDRFSLEKVISQYEKVLFE